jgi:hypothetical protein
MKLTIDIDLNTDSREQIAMVANLLNNVTNAARRPTSTQPQVVENSGSAGPGLSGDSAVSGEVAQGKVTPVDATSPTPVKEAKRRSKKEEAAAQVGEPAAATATAGSTATQTLAPADAKQENETGIATATLDDVRTALQAFTASKGVPAGIELLKEFGAARISELKADQFGAFILRCGNV